MHMDITPYVESFRRDLATAADAAGPEGRAAAERMLLALEPAFRLTTMELLSQAAAEITAELPAGVVEMRLRGRDPEIVVAVPPATEPPRPPHPPAPPAPPDSEDTEDGDVVARVTLRIPESVKVRAEELAAKGGYSLNSWIVTVLRAATSSRPMNVDIDLSSIPFLDQQGGHGRGGSRRMTGWI
jgi:hypothetical protein